MSSDVMCVMGGDVVLPGGVERADLTISNGRIRHVGLSSESATHDAVLDVSGMLVAPGLIDLQCNGAGGADVTDDPAAIDTMSSALPQFGVTSFLPTVVSSAASSRTRAIEAMTRFRRRTGCARPLGLHFEGPAISPFHLGAHDAAFVTPPRMLRDELEEWVQSGFVALVTLAPELDAAIGLIEQLCANGIVVFAGHTSMNPCDLQRARAAGLQGVTHLFNAMAAFRHREPGPVGAVLGDDSVVASVICDGIHVDPVAVRAAWRSLGPERIVLVSDATAALGEPDGLIQLRGRAVTHQNTGVRTAEGVLAGGAVALDQAVRNLVEFTGCSVTEALGAATAVPAGVLGRPDIGRIAVGARGDLAVFDEQLRLRQTIVDGAVAWSHEPAGS